MDTDEDAWNYHWAANLPDTFKVQKAEKQSELMKTDAIQQNAVLKHPKIKKWFLLAGDHRQVERITDKSWGWGGE